MNPQLATEREPAISNSLRFLDTLTRDYRPKNFAVRLWDGTTWGDADHPRFTLMLKHLGALRNMFSSPSELSLGESFIWNDFDIEGDLEGAFELADFLVAHKFSLKEKLLLRAKLPGFSARRDEAAANLELTGTRHSKGRDRSAVTYHYDVSNDFYTLWLDRRMVYSCAYFNSAHDDLDAAQTRKLDYICKKLRLRKGDRLLDLGCGWGGLVIHAAQHYGVQALGITLSVPQAEVARERIRREGLEERCKVEVCDYRELDAQAQYDKIVSVGMFEHVGEELLPEYFQRAWHALLPGGVFLNHGIAAAATFQRKGPSFIDKYIFPDSDLVPVSTPLRVAEGCGFEVRDLESLREHYALTLQHWVRRLEEKALEAKRIVGEVIYREWRLYMAGSAHGFRSGRLNVYQVLFAKPERGCSHLPLTREDWYS
jgi:cyclopropane-fatty-acyl-phospholipid synthase